MFGSINKISSYLHLFVFDINVNLNRIKVEIPYTLPIEYRHFICISYQIVPIYNVVYESQLAIVR